MAEKRQDGLASKAKSAGKSTAQFAREHSQDKGSTGSQARYYMNVLRKAHPKSRHGVKASETKVPETTKPVAKSARPKSRRG